MSEQKSNKELQKENEQLQEANDVLGNQQAGLEQRVLDMEALIQQQMDAGVYAGPEPVLYHDPYDQESNPHHIKTQPEGKVLGWMNPNIRNGTRGWRGWTPVEYDDEYGKDLGKYITDPPAKMEGIATQDNYVRRGTDTILCWIPEEMYKARQLKREAKALRKQLAANATQNTVLGPGVSTFGDGVQKEESPPGGFKARSGASPLTSQHPSHRTEMLGNEE